MSLSKSDIRQALRQACGVQFAGIPSEAAIDYTFSPAFCQRMDALVREQERGSLRLMSRTRRRILVVAAILIAALLLVACTPTLRQAVVRLLSPADDDRIHYEVSGELRGELETRYTLGYLPEGFTLHSQDQPQPNGYQTTYVNGSGQKLILEQSIAKWVGGFVVNSTDTIQTSVNGDPVLITFSSVLCNAHWVHDGYFFYLTYFCEAVPEVEAEIVQIIGSLQPVE